MYTEVYRQKVNSILTVQSEYVKVLIRITVYEYVYCICARLLGYLFRKAINTPSQKTVLRKGLVRVGVYHT